MRPAPVTLIGVGSVFRLRRSHACSVLRLGAGGSAMTFCRVALDGLALALEALRTVEPSLGHPVPCRLARRIARELRHLLAVRRVPQKFFRWIHGRSSCSWQSFLVNRFALVVCCLLLARSRRSERAPRATICGGDAKALRMVAEPQPAKRQ